MADSDITIAQLRVELAAIKSALAAGNYALALNKCAIAQATLAGLEESKGDGGIQVKFRTDLQALKTLILEAKAAATESTGSGGFDQTLVDRPTE
jgi:hypothetical protein